MIIVDRALKKRQKENNPVRVAMIGAGFMGRGIALQIKNYVPGMELVAISNRHVGRARRAYQEAGTEAFKVVETRSGAKRQGRNGRGETVGGETVGGEIKKFSPFH